MRSLRAAAVAAILAPAAFAAATFTIRLQTFPAAEVADGHSQIVVSAQVFDDGHAAADGTQVVFESDLGSFRESVVRTSNGFARATLVAGGVPGIAHIKANATLGDATGSTTEVEFVKSREELSQARETIEAVASGSLIYANDRKLIEATGAEKGAVVRYRDIEIRADQIQLDLTNFTLRAKKATVRRGRRTTVFDSLFLDLSARTGYGLTNYTAPRPDSIVAYPGGVAMVETSSTGEQVVAKPRSHFGMVALERDDERPQYEALGYDPFEMADLSTSPSVVGSKKLVVYARREVQFHQADIYVNNARLIRLPLFVVQLNGGSGSPMVTDDLLSINDNQIALNYPHYLALRPGLSSLLRFRTGERYGDGLSGSRSASLDYELAWSKGDDMQGGFTFAGLASSSWVATLRQYYRLGGRTTANLEVDSPAGKSVFGSGSISHPLGPYTLSLNGSQSQSLNGIQLGGQNFQNYSLGVDRNPERIPHSWFHYTYGVTANNSRTVSYLYNASTKKFDQTQVLERSGAGLASRLYSDSIALDKKSSLNASMGATRLFGPTAYDGIALTGTVNVSRRLSNTASAIVTYNYLQDGLNDAVIGRHSLSLIGNYGFGKTALRMSISKGIGVDRFNVGSEASYRFSSLWRFSLNYYMNQFGNQYASTSLSEYFAIISYRIAWREVGLTWSSRTHRPGIQLMNVTF